MAEHFNHVALDEVFARIPRANVESGRAVFGLFARAAMLDLGWHSGLVVWMTTVARVAKNGPETAREEDGVRAKNAAKEIPDGWQSGLMRRS